MKLAYYTTVLAFIAVVFALCLAFGYLFHLIP